MSAFSSTNRGFSNEKPQARNERVAITRLDALEDEDEFEEFNCKDWKLLPALADDELWESNWDNEVQEDQFIQQLRAELSKEQSTE